MRVGIALCLFCALLLTGCYRLDMRGGPVEGVVVEEASERPLVGAHVIAKWNVMTSSWGGPINLCLYADAVVTDEAGRFHVPAWEITDPEAKKRFGDMVMTVQEYVIYAPGYAPRQVARGSAETSPIRIVVKPMPHPQWVKEVWFKGPSHVWAWTCHGPRRTRPFVGRLYHDFLAEPGTSPRDGRLRDLLEVLERQPDRFTLPTDRPAPENGS